MVVREPVAFNLLMNDKLVRVQPRAGESLRLQTPASDPDPESVAVRPVVLPAYTGDASGVPPVFASALIDRMRAGTELHPAVRGACARQQPARVPDPVPDEPRRAHGVRAPCTALPRRAGDARGRGRLARVGALAVDPERRPGAARTGRRSCPTARCGSAPSARERERGRAHRVRRLRARRHARRADRRGRGLPGGTTPGLEAARRLRARDRDQALVGPDHELHTRGAPGPLVVGVVNFPPRQIGPVRSEVLVLGTYSDEGVLLLAPEQQAALGDRVG